MVILGDLGLAGHSGDRRFVRLAEFVSRLPVVLRIAFAGPHFMKLSHKL